MDPSLPVGRVDLWRADAVVLLGWLMSVELHTVPSRIPRRRRDSRTSGHVPATRKGSEFLQISPAEAMKETVAAIQASMPQK